MRLQEFLTRTEMKPSDFAKRIGASPSVVHHWLEGTRTPSYKNMVKISNNTCGLVDPNSWGANEAQA